MPSTVVAINPAPLATKSARRLSNPPLSPTKPFSIAIPSTFGEITPPSSPSEDEESAAKVPKPAEFSSPAPFKHYVGRSSFFSVNVNPDIAVEEPLPDSPTSSTADPGTPPLSPATRPTVSSIEVPEEGASISAILVPKFRHAPVQKSSFPININGSRSRPPVRPSDETPEPSSQDTAKLAAAKAAAAAVAAEMYLPPSPALTPSHSSTVEEANALNEFDKPPTKHSRRCRLCKTWIQTRSGPGEGKLTHGVRMHMLKWHTAELGISVCRDDVGQRGVGEGWIL